MKRFDVITIFPDIIKAYTDTSILGRAQKRKLMRVRGIDLRNFTTDRHKTVDDAPFGGGPGMVLRADVIARAVRYAKRGDRSGTKTRTILFSTRGRAFDQLSARRLARYDRLVFICGRYEGVDERVASDIADEEISIGDFVLSGGELPALVVLEAVARHVPGVLGKSESLEEVNGSYPVYTRPRDMKSGGNTLSVPEVLLGGNHKEIENWRKKKQEG